MSILIRGLGVTDKKAPIGRVGAVRRKPFPHFVDPLIRENARALAALFYEGFQYRSEVEHSSGDSAPAPFGMHRSPEFYAFWPTAKIYVSWCWPLYVKDARATMAKLLNSSSIADGEKEKIFAALQRQYLHDVFGRDIAAAIIEGEIKVVAARRRRRAA